MATRRFPICFSSIPNRKIYAKTNEKKERWYKKLAENISKSRRSHPTWTLAFSMDQSTNSMGPTPSQVYDHHYDDYYDTEDDYDNSDESEEYGDSDESEEYGDSDDSEYYSSDDSEDSPTSIKVEKNIGWAIRNQDEPPEYFSQQLEILKPEWKTFYTDASWSEWEDYMGLAWVCPILKKVRKFRVTSDWTSNQGEAIAIVMTLGYIEHSDIQKAVICSDSLGTLDALKNFQVDDTDEVIWDIQKYCNILHSMGKEIEFWWCPSHMGIDGNEQADEAAGDAKFNGHYIHY